MSSDNGYIIRKHPDGGFCAVDYSMSLYIEDSYKTPDGYPMPTGREEQFPTMQAALDACDSGYILDTYYSEYGVHLDAECLNIQKDLRNELHLSVEPDDPDFRCTCGFMAPQEYGDTFYKHQADSLREQLRQLN